MPTPKEKIDLVVSIDRTTKEKKIEIENNLSEKGTETQNFIRDWVGHTADTLTQVIEDAAEKANFPKLLSSALFYIASVEYDYLRNLETEQNRVGGSFARDRAVAIGQTIGGMAASYLGAAGVGLTTKSLPSSVSAGIFMKENYESKLLASGTKTPKEFLGYLIRDSFDKISIAQTAIEFAIDNNPTQTQTSIYNLKKVPISDGVLVAGPGSNIMQGDGAKNTYYIPELTGSNILSDINSNGRIVIGKDPQSVMLEGDAVSKKDSNGNVIEGQWSLNGYDLIRSGDNLVIVPAGADISSVDTPRITINNFDFSSTTPKFGINLGKIKTDELSGPVFVEDTQVINSILFSANDKKGRFFAPVMASGANGNINYAIRIYDASGFAIGTQKLTDFEEVLNADASGISQGVNSNAQAARLANGNVAFIYGTEEITYGANSRFISGKSSAHLAVVDSKGHLVSNQKIDEVISTDRATHLSNFYAPSAISGARDDGRNCVCFTRGGNRFFCGDFSDGGGLVGSLTETSDLTNFNGPTQAYSTITLPSGGRIEGSYYPKGFKISSPIYRNPTPEEIRPNYTPPAGVFEVNPLAQEELVTLQKNIGTTLQITPKENSRIAISGLSASSGSKIDLSQFGLTPEEISARTFTAKSSDYSLDDLLKGKFVPPQQERRMLRGRRNLQEESSAPTSTPTRIPTHSTSYEESSSPSSTPTDTPTDSTYYSGYADDDYNEEPLSTDEIELLLNDSDQEFTVMLLPNNQTLIFPDIAAQNLTQNIGSFFALTAEPTTYPTGQRQPSSQPSLQTQPSSHPSHQELQTGEPTNNSAQPTGFESESILSGEPTSFPTRWPNAVSSNQGSLQPSIWLRQPSIAPDTFSPTNFPTNNQVTTNSNITNTLQHNRDPLIAGAVGLAGLAIAARYRRPIINSIKSVFGFGGSVTDENIAAQQTSSNSAQILPETVIRTTAANQVKNNQNLQQK